MVRDELTLRYLTNAAAIAFGGGGMLLLWLALVIEIARRHNSRARVVVVVDRFMPAPARRGAVALVALLSTLGGFVGPSAAYADTSVRHWLSDSAPATTPSVPSSAPPDSTAPARVADPPTPTPPTPDPRTPDPRPTDSPPADGPTIAAPPPDPRPTPVVHAAPSVSPATVAPSRPQRRTQAPGRTASGKSSRSVPTPSVVASPAPNADARYVVAAGDCLWTIAARFLGPGATNRAIDRGWRQIYDANRTSVGENPSLIRPGLALTISRLDNTP